MAAKLQAGFEGAPFGWVREILGDTLMNVERDDWLVVSSSKVRTMLKSRRATGDRLALIRTLVWLQGGRLALDAERIVLSPEEEGLLGRFGLRRTGDNDALRLDDDGLDDIVPGLGSAMALDPDVRTVFPSAAPDAPLLRFSQHSRYRSETQKAAVNALFAMPAGGALMVSMPTGSGKSLLFQIAPLWWRTIEAGACVVVVTPTVALATDHERTLRGLPGLENCRALTGSMSPSAKSEVLDAFRRGEIPVLFLSPEAAFGSARSALLEAALPESEKHGLGARLMGFFVDEAHIIESWGRTFRPNFQRLPALLDALLERNPDLRTVLLSATLNGAARDVLRQGYSHGPWLEIHAGVPRYDFDLLVQAYDDEGDRNDTVLKVLDRVPRPAIVYTTQVEHADRLFQKLTAER